MRALRAVSITTLLAAIVIAQENAVPAALTAKEMHPIDFAKVDRALTRQPAYCCDNPRYGLFLFGANGERRVWAVLDKSKPDAEAYDVLYLDRDADGDLTESGERITGTISHAKYGKKEAQAKFAIGDFRDPGTRAVHTGFELTWTPASVRFKMLWRGGKVTMGCYGPYAADYQNFAPSAKSAPIFVPGYDRPFEFQHWRCDKLKRGASKDFKVFVGNRGDRKGAFVCVDDEFLPAKEYVQATLLYRDTNDKEKQVLVKLTRRC